jgi:hypothetical protein
LVTEQRVLLLQSKPRSENQRDLNGDDFEDDKHAVELAISPAIDQHFSGDLGFEKGQGCVVGPAGLEPATRPL